MVNRNLPPIATFPPSRSLTAKDRAARTRHGRFEHRAWLFGLAVATLFLLGVPHVPGSEPAHLDVEKTVERVQDGVIAYYPLIEGEGATAADYSEFGAPLNLRVSDGVEWIAGRNGVRFSGQGALVGQNAAKLNQAIRSSREFTFELWCRRDGVGGFQSLVSLTRTGAERNVRLSSWLGRFMIGLVRTTETRATGGLAAIANLHKKPQEHHFVLRFADETATLFRDGQAISERQLVGTTANWGLNHNLFVGNDFNGESPWHGELYLLAVYNRALSDREIRLNFEAGNRAEGLPEEEEPDPAARVDANPPGGPAEPPAENKPPRVNAGPDRTVSGGHAGILLAAAVADDGLPNGQLEVTWAQLNGPGEALFADRYRPDTRVECNAYGRYVLELTASDGELTSTDTLTLDIERGVGGSARVEQDLIAFYPFHEGAGRVALDESGYGNSLDLEMTEGVSWLPGRWGVQLAKYSKLQSAAAEKIQEAVTSANAFSFEVWATPLNNTQGGPARLLSNSWDAQNRNFTMGPQHQEMHVRLRTTESTLNGSPYLVQAEAVLPEPQHFLVTYDGSLLSLYRGGELLKQKSRHGDLSNWNPEYPLIVGNEQTNDRSWQGEVYLVAVYSRALSASEVSRNYQVGDDISTGGNPVPNTPPIVDAGPDRTVLWPFDLANLSGSASDDGLPGNAVTASWSKVDGPGDVTFDPADQVATTAMFSAPGVYTVRLAATDGELNAEDDLIVHVTESLRVRTDLVAFYPLNEGSADRVYDQSGYGEPLHLELSEGVTWLPGRNGVNLVKYSKLLSGAAAKVHQAITSANQFTFEVWAEADNIEQGGPARLMSYSHDADNRNLTIGQQQTEAEIRLRTTETNSNGGWKHLEDPNGFTTELRHYVVTFDGRMLSLLLDGQLVKSELREGDLSNWDASYPVIIGNEFEAERSWRGNVFAAAIYKRALSEAEVRRNFRVGANLNQGGNAIGNEAPIVEAGEAQTITVPSTYATLAGEVSDDGLPSNTVTVSWSLVSGPGTATFTPPDAVDTMVDFSVPGAYRLRLTANDGDQSSSDEVDVTLNESDRVTRGLVAYYPMTEMSGEVVHDRSGNGTPLDLAMDGEVNWLGGGNGVLLGDRAKLVSGIASKLHQSLTTANAFTFESWGKALNTEQGGPARLMTYSLDPHNRNFTLGQQTTLAEIRLRTTASTENGHPYLKNEQGFTTALHHYLVSFDGRMLRFYRDGQLFQTEAREGDLSNWDPNYFFLIGNEHDGWRTWQGEVHQSAVYDRALSAPEVRRNFLVGSNIQDGGNPVANQAPEVGAGGDRTITLPKDTIPLAGFAADDGLPADTLGIEWSQISGPGTVVFSNATLLNSTATFPADGDYELRLTVNDGQFEVTDDVVIEVISGAIPRLLEQATWGPTNADMDYLRQVGIDQFIQEQINAIPSTYPDVETSSLTPVQAQFFLNAMYGPDQLRQRMAFALGQILVVSGNTVGKSYKMIPYLRILHQHALGNFEDLLLDVALSPTMGEFLDNVNNGYDPTGENPPNENFGREVLQLFSVGRKKLNIDGTPQTGTGGEPIEPYTEETVRELSRALTGWTYPPQLDKHGGWTNSPHFDGPMVPVEEKHDPGEKILMDGFVLPAGQPAQLDMYMAIEHIFSHPNVGPFICRNLIQHLVLSDPSPAYVARVATVFNDNGQGVRGDLAAVARAILIDPEAQASTAEGGHLREPILFALTLMRNLEANVPIENRLRDRTRAMGQDLLFPPSVFNFYSPFFRIPDTGVIAPEFQLHTSSNAINRANFVYKVVRNWIGGEVAVDFSRFESLAAQPEQLLDEIDWTLFQGRMSEKLRQTIIGAILVTDNTETRVQNAIFIAATSSEYQVQH